MKNTSRFISMLSVNEQKQIRTLLMNCEELENEDNKLEIIENAMSDRINLLENFINLELIISDELQNICNQWEMDFKGDLLENIEEDIEVYGTIKNYIEYLVNEVFPIWVDESLTECKENTSLYINYQNRLKNILDEL